MIAAEKLLEEEKVEIISNDEKRTEARVAGSGGVRHTVILDRESEKERCTCTWFSSNQGERGGLQTYSSSKETSTMEELKKRTGEIIQGLCGYSGE